MNQNLLPYVGFAFELLLAAPGLARRVVFAEEWDEKKAQNFAIKNCEKLQCHDSFSRS